MMSKRFIIIFILIGACVGLLLTWQVLTKTPSGGTFLTDELQARDELLKGFLDDQAYLQSRIVTLRKTIEDAQNKINKQSKTSTLAILESLKKDVGLSEIRGNGLEITLDDSPFALRKSVSSSEAELIQAADIRDVVNVLNAADVDGISVNNQRIIATSPIISVGTTLLVNNSYIAPPFTISAVGDTDVMLQRLLNEKLLSSLYDRSAKYKLLFKIAKKDLVTVPRYNGDFRTNYLNLIN